MPRRPERNRVLPAVELVAPRCYIARRRCGLAHAKNASAFVALSFHGPAVRPIAGPPAEKERDHGAPGAYCAHHQHVLKTARVVGIVIMRRLLDACMPDDPVPELCGVGKPAQTEETIKKLTIAAALCILLAACTTITDVTPAGGRTYTVTTQVRGGMTPWGEIKRAASGEPTNTASRKRKRCSRSTCKRTAFADGRHKRLSLFSDA